MIKGVIFDLGNTLIEFTGDWESVTRLGAEAMATWFLKKKHIRLDSTVLVETFIAERTAAQQVAQETQTEVPAEQTLRVTLDKIAAPLSTGLLVAAAIKIFFEPEEAAYRPYADAADTLKILQDQGYRLGLFSNATDDPLVQRLVNQNRLRPWLAPTFSSAGCGWRKPKREAFALIAARWALPVGQIVVVGDTPQADILGARNAGMTSILMARSEVSGDAENQLARPTATAGSLAQLPDLISQL